MNESELKIGPLNKVKSEKVRPHHTVLEMSNQPDKRVI